MRTQQQIRDLLGPADPARGVVVSPARLSAHQVILQVESSAPPARMAPSRRASRRTVLVGAAVAAAVVASAGLLPVIGDRGAPTEPTPRQPVDGSVLQLVGYEIATDAEPAGPHLRALAGRITDAPYDREGGRYAYHRVKSWGGAMQQSKEGYVASYVEERQSWATSDGRRWTDMTVLGMEFPDAASRDYWTKQLPGPAVGLATPPAAGPVEEPRDREDRRLPTDRAGLARLLRTDLPALDMADAVYNTYVRHLVPRRTRADVLTILADKPGFVWRGRVVDRAGRPGLGVTADLTLPAERPEDEQRYQMLLIFDPNTGELLAQEYLEQAPKQRVLRYGLLLQASRTDTLG
ncbi:CU044_5270 family protein [Micromonospora sp. NPDC048999]|uniref:CU044_5270 family protein n=1 Tax=Micromonospora sp. NPDC048999 TaxID=3155391 RepID=UPI0033DF73B5